MHRDRDGVRRLPHLNQDVRNQTRPGLGTAAGLQALCSQHDLRKHLRVEQRFTEHVAARPFAGAVGNGCREIGACLRPQRRLVDRQPRKRHPYLESRGQGVVGNVDRPGKVVRSDDVVVSGIGQRTAAIHQDGEQRFLGDHIVRAPEMRGGALGTRGSRDRLSRGAGGPALMGGTPGQEERQQRRSRTEGFATDGHALKLAAWQ